MANALRKGGYKRVTSIKLAQLLTRDDTRCSICGIPKYWLHLMPFWKCGSEKTNRRLTVDHINANGPSTLKNSRPLCFSCNTLRGHQEKTDEQVLNTMRAWYLQYFTSRFLFWLNTSPGHGGRLHRNAYTEARDRRLHGES